jgi:hypothetical protein
LGSLDNEPSLDDGDAQKAAESIGMMPNWFANGMCERIRSENSPFVVPIALQTGCFLSFVSGEKHCLERLTTDS